MGSPGRSSGPDACVRYLIATSETPNRTPAAVANSSASERWTTSCRVEILTSVTPSAKIPVSTAISAAREARCGPSALAVRPRTTNPTAVIKTPAHCRRPSSNPKNRSASTARNTSPPERIACTVESGASASASTWKAQATKATIQPMANQRDRNRPATLRSGWRTSTVRASPAPRALNSALTFVPSADTSAMASPRIIVGRRGWPVEGETNCVCAACEPPGAYRLGSQSALLVSRGRRRAGALRA